jgi:type VI secretion system protein ImpH
VTEDGRIRLVTRFLGMFGPQGALPLYVTETAKEWLNAHDPSFARFVDIFSTRFQQLFFRAWADARPIAQYERPDSDRFLSYLASFAGFGTPALRNVDTTPDEAKLPFVGIAGMQVKTARGLVQILHGIFGIDAEIVEWVGTWLDFEPDDRLRLGAGSCMLSGDAFVGKRVFSINERIRVKILCDSQQQYENFLPVGAEYKRLTDLIFFYLGYRQEVEIQLGISAETSPHVALGKRGRLGWTAWLERKQGASAPYYFDAHFRV